MSARVYLLLDILEDKFAYAMEKLQNADGVMAADILEGHPNVLVIMQSNDRQKLVELMITVLRPLEYIIQDLHLLMTREDYIAPCFYGIRNIKTYLEQIMN